MLNQVFNVNISSNETGGHHVPDVMHEEKHPITSDIPARNAYLEFNYEDTSDKPKWRDICAKYLTCAPQKRPHHGEQRQTEELLQIQGD